MNLPDSTTPNEMNNVDRQYAAAKERIKAIEAEATAAKQSGTEVDPALKDEYKKLTKMCEMIERTKYREGEFDKEFIDLWLSEPFLGSVSMGIGKYADFSVPTAYVGVRKTDNSYDVVMGFNPTFMRDMTPRQRQGVIRHELYHVIFSHIFSRAMGDKRLSKLHNWATDLAINSIIGKDNLPSMCLIPGHRNVDPATGKPVDGVYADFIANAPPMQASDWYFAELVKLMQENDHDESQITIGVGDGIGQMDDHSGWDQIPEEVQDEIRERIREMIESGAARADAAGNGWGNMPQEIQEWIRKYISREVDWRSIVRSFFGRVRSQERTSTLKRINKKMPYVNPGVKRKTMAKFACFIDQSGSMSDKDIAMLFGELENFCKETEIDVFHFDTQIDEKSRTIWRKGSLCPKPHRTRCGGTDFDAVANFCNDSKNRASQWSGVVILTDGYAPTMSAIRGAKVLWVITESGTMDAVRPGDLACRMAKNQGSFKKY